MQVDISGTIVELSDRQLELFHDMTTLQQDVALLKLTGLSNVDAYTYGGGTATNYDSIRATSSEILAQPSVVRFTTEMRNVKFASTIMSRDEMAAQLSALTRTKISDVVEVYNGPDLICSETDEIVTGQTFWKLKPLDEMSNAGLGAISELVAGRDGLKIKTHSQLAAAKQLSELLGYNKPQQLEVSVSKSLDDLYADFDDE